MQSRISARRQILVFVVFTLAFSMQSWASDVDSVLYTVSKAVCEVLKQDPSLDHKVATLPDGAESHEMLQSIFGEREMVERFFAENTQVAVLPTTGRHGCLQFSEFGIVHLSLPVFSENGKRAFVYVHEVSGWGGHGVMYEVTLVDGRWRVAERRALWVT